MYTKYKMIIQIKWIISVDIDITLFDGFANLYSILLSHLKEHDLNNDV